jgi:hypothetical protein
VRQRWEGKWGILAGAASVFAVGVKIGAAAKPEEADRGASTRQGLLPLKTTARAVNSGEHARETGALIRPRHSLAMDRCIWLLEGERSHSMQVVYERCCGVDVHKRTVVAGVLASQADGAVEREGRTCATMTAER